MDNDILVSVVIPVKNGDAWLNETIPAILGQELNAPFEIIAIDSGSTDNTLGILAKYPVQLIHILPGEFNHGLTRNLGVHHAKGKYIVMTVQDAKPISRQWIQELLNGFLDDTVMAVCGQQIVPHEKDKNPVEWFRPLSKGEPRKYYFPEQEIFASLSKDEQWQITRLDNVNSMYKRTALVEIPFRETDFAEDALWAKDALMAGYGLVYTPRSQVAHYHHEDYDHVFTRNFIYIYQSYIHFGVFPANTNRQKQLASIINILLKEKEFSLSDKLKWFRHNLRKNLALKRSELLFLKTLSTKGRTGLDMVYGDLSKAIPQAPKSESKN